MNLMGCTKLITDYGRNNLIKKTRHSKTNRKIYIICDYNNRTDYIPLLNNYFY